MHFLNYAFFYKNYTQIIFYRLKKNFVLWTCHSMLNEQGKIFIGKSVNRFILRSLLINWVRVAFKGKGYRLRKFKGYNKLTFNFGHSHWAKVLLQSKFYYFYKIRRQNYICLIKTRPMVTNFKTLIKFSKLLNRYTKRGLRLRKQFIKRRFGKISQVVSQLH